VPVALSGGLLALALGDAQLTVGAAAGFLALLGLAVRIQLVSICRFQEPEGVAQSVPGAAPLLRAARERMSPILATVLGLALMMAPLVLLGSRAGLEIVHPMAVVVVGGLVTTAFVALFVLPSLYLRHAVAAPPLAGRRRLLAKRHFVPAAPVDEPSAAAVPQNGAPLSEQR
jgi:Cu/Ag efflux pump CusA